MNIPLQVNVLVPAVCTIVAIFSPSICWSPVTWFNMFSADTTAPVTDCSETTIYLSPMDVFSPNSFNATDNSGLVVSYNFSHPNDNAGSPTIYPGMAINTIASSFSWLPLDGSGNDGTACDITVVPRGEQYSSSSIGCLSSARATRVKILISDNFWCKKSAIPFISYLILMHVYYWG